MSLRGQHVVVVGLARSGRAAAALALREGARVTAADARLDAAPVPGATMALGPHDRALFLSADLIVVSPGVPASQPDLVAARRAGVPVLGELAFAALHLHAPLLAITGTNGKSTTTWLLGQLLAASGYRPFVGGNLGQPLSLAALESEPADVLVVEVSSYQMELAGRFHPQVGVILNLTPDHLERHGDMETYGAMKCRLFQYMESTDLAVIPHDDARLVRLAGGLGGTRALLGALPGVQRVGRSVQVALSDGRAARFDLSAFGVPGEHNLDNLAAALLAAFAVGADAKALQAAIAELEPLAHRMQIVSREAGLIWVDDSKATNVEAALAGLSGLDELGPGVVLLGGQAKGAGFAALVPKLTGQRAVICFGGSGPAIHAELRDAGLDASLVGSLEQAVALARTLAVPGDVVLLSPGCASFDAFRDFEHRGEVFAALAKGA